MAKTLERYRRSPFIIGHWQLDGLHMLNLSTDRTLVASPEAMDVLSSCAAWSSVDQIVQRLPHRSSGTIARQLSALAEATMIMRWGEPLRDRDQHLRDWGAWSPAAAHFHLATRNELFNDPTKVKPIVMAQPTRPASAKKYPDRPTLELPHFPRNGELVETLLKRRTWRRFDEAPIPLELLATLCGLTFGVHAWVVFDGMEPQALKTSPSGGARHSIEAYVCARNVDGLPAGIYHYGPDTHALTLLREGLTSAQLGTFLPVQPWYEDAAFVVFMTSVFSRVQWRYRKPRAYRNVFLEAGHLAQTFCLLATRAVLAPFCTAAISEDAIESALGINGVSEAVLYAVGAGVRPPNVDWAPVREGAVMPLRQPITRDRSGSSDDVD